jgi:hypothetical protein
MYNLKTLSRAVIGMILIITVASVLVQQSTHAASNKSTAPIRGYYLTQGTYDGNQALTACAAGYHMASLWEIHEPSNLRYDTALGLTGGDSGAGPPANGASDEWGWIRTGTAGAFGNPGFPGMANCGAWTDNATDNAGTVVGLSSAWGG